MDRKTYVKLVADRTGVDFDTVSKVLIQAETAVLEIIATNDIIKLKFGTFWGEWTPPRKKSIKENNLMHGNGSPYTDAYLGVPKMSWTSAAKTYQRIPSSMYFEIYGAPPGLNEDDLEKLKKVATPEKIEEAKEKIEEYKKISPLKARLSSPLSEDYVRKMQDLL